MEEVSALKKLPVPSEKKRCQGYFERQFPFPVIVDESPPSTSSASTSFGVSKDQDTGGNRKVFVGVLENDCVTVKEKSSIKALFGMGFFGKSSLSDRTPLAFLEQSKIQKSLSIENMQSDSSSDDEDRHWKRQRKDPPDDSEKTKESTNEAEVSKKEEEDTAEKLILTFEEAFFLSYDLGVLIVLDKDQPMNLFRMWTKLCELTPGKTFPVMYTAYHHLRSKGWIVRNGAKNGVDYVLYKHGPLYYHSTYAVIVKPVKEKNLKDIVKDRMNLSWKTLSAINRQATHAGKSLMFLYVIKPELMSENKVSTPFCVSNFKVEEVLIKRWVPESGREDET